MASRVLVNSGALIDKIIGDQVAGTQHAGTVIQAAPAIMSETGHGIPDGPWILLGAGVHPGVAFVDTVGSEDGTSDLTVLGDVPNTAARMSSQAGEGEILISGSAVSAEGLEKRDLPIKELALKGKHKRVKAYRLPRDMNGE